MSVGNDGLSKAGREYGQAQNAALGWIARLRSDQADDADRRAFALWLQEDSSHAAAMDAALEFWDVLGLALRARGPDAKRPDGD